MDAGAREGAVVTGQWVVVGLTEQDCEQIEGRDCVSWVQGPFASRDEAAKLAAWVPQGFNAHIMRVDEPMGTGS